MIIRQDEDGSGLYRYFLIPIVYQTSPTLLHRETKSPAAGIDTPGALLVSDCNVA
jgi:hypothetical protein